jgi:hypothetical protein
LPTGGQAASSQLAFCFVGRFLVLVRSAHGPPGNGGHKVAPLSLLEGSKMRRIGALGSALVALIAGAAALAIAPSNGVAQDISRAVAGGSTTPRTLAPSEIMMEVRRTGFEPISRPVQRGSVYVVVALDGDDLDVRLTIDAHSGRLLWVADVRGTRYGGYYGYPAGPRRVRPPVPPVDIPSSGPDRNNLRPDTTAAFVRPSPPLPRTRPGELTSAVNKESAVPAPAAAPVNPDVAPAAKLPPVTMVPVAPLE